MLLSVADEACGVVLIPLYNRKGFSHPGDALLTSPVYCSKGTNEHKRANELEPRFWDIGDELLGIRLPYILQYNGGRVKC